MRLIIRGRYWYLCGIITLIYLINYQIDKKVTNTCNYNKSRHYKPQKQVLGPTFFLYDRTAVFIHRRGSKKLFGINSHICDLLKSYNWSLSRYDIKKALEEAYLPEEKKTLASTSKSNASSLYNIVNSYLETLRDFAVELSIRFTIADNMASNGLNLLKEINLNWLYPKIENEITADKIYQGADASLKFINLLNAIMWGHNPIIPYNTNSFMNFYFFLWISIMDRARTLLIDYSISDSISFVSKMFKLMLYLYKELHMVLDEPYLILLKKEIIELRYRYRFLKYELQSSSMEGK